MSTQSHPLDQLDQKDNSKVWDTWFYNPNTNRLVAARKKLFLQFCIDQGITLRNVQEVEKQKVMKILLEIPSEEEFRNALIRWKNSLKQAVYCQGNEIYTSTYSSIINSNKAQTAYLTDQDLNRALRNYIDFPESIQQPGKYIFSAKSIADIQDALERFYKNENKLIPGKYTLLIPVHSKNHWRLAQITLHKNSQDASLTNVRASLWDPLPNNNLTSTSDADCEQLATTTQTVFKARVSGELKYAGIQRNGHSCGDYVIQQALKEKLGSNAQDPVVQAQNATQLRNAVIRSIKTPGSKATSSLPTIDVNKQNASLQIHFDSIFAKKIKEALNQQGNISKELEDQLREKTEKEVGYRLKL